MSPPSRSGGRILVDQLLIHGARLGACVPGESYLEVLDALFDFRDRFRMITCRHEGAAANMAAAWGKLTGRPGLCFVTRGPGATQAATGVHTAAQDSSPMVLFVGQVGRLETGRDAFQELDYPAVFGSMAKWAVQVNDPRRIPELVARAFVVACSGRPGPVVMALPEDVLTDGCQVDDARPYRVAEPAPPVEQADALLEELWRARRPLVIAGGSGWDVEACANLRTWAEGNRLPVASAFRQQDVIDNRSDSYAGELGLGAGPELHARVREADLVVALGTRLDGMTTRGYSLVEAPRPRQRLAHVYPAADELGTIYQPDLAVVSSPGAMLRALAASPPAGAVPWAEWTAAARREHLANSVPQAQPGDLNLGEVVRTLRGRLPDDAVVTNGAGNFSGWVSRHFEFRQPATQLAPQSGSMGYGLPAALAAKAARPESPAICVAGDGDFLMYASELSTAVQHGLSILVLVVNNGMYGTIRMHQEREHPGRTIATDIADPDFVALARSFGVFGELVERTDEFPPALERALACGGPALIELRVDPDAVSHRTTLSEIRASAGS